ncbi:MAG: response regulator [Lachnospiraceae bacterium]|nr:response regulator [Lachnospiraceae bacterium]
MNKIRIHRFIITMITIAAIGLIIDGAAEHWEPWVTPLLIIGTVGMWTLHFGQFMTERIRESVYLGFAMFMVFYHGVHKSSFYDVCTVITLMIVLFSLYDRLYVMTLIVIEYVVIMIYQFAYVVEPGDLTFDTLTVSRLLLQVVIVVSILFICRLSVIERLEKAEALEERNDDMEKNENDMEDFLSNISHELRTPVNVVNGMSELMIKRNAGDEAFSIKNAGIRLAYQIEDVQDYTECKRQRSILEEEDYMSTSLVNDMVAGFRLIDLSENLELIVDLDPDVPTMMRGDIKKLRKIFRHLLENGVKFTRRGGIYVRMYAEKKEYGVNLCIEVTDTGIGMDERAIEAIAEGMFQVNKKRNRSSGGIGLGLFIVYGFAHRMGGFVRIESKQGSGTTVRVTIPQKVVNDRPCLELPEKYDGDILFHVRSEKYRIPQIREFYRSMATHLATGIRARLYSADSIKEIERLSAKLDVRYVFMGQEEYETDPAFFDGLCEKGITVAVSAAGSFRPNPGSRVIVMPKPLYAYPVIRILNGETADMQLDPSANMRKPVFKDVRALVVDDEPMNLVVANGLFKDYEMIIDTAASGRESIEKYRMNDYDVIFMDHMMPEMDGVEAMKLIKEAAAKMNRTAVVVALTANAVSGAREMFMKEGFDGFIAKPINIAEFERVMMRLLPERNSAKGGERS